MKLTLDHNVIIDLAQGSPNIINLKEGIASSRYEAYVVEIGASEFHKLGIRPDRYDLFEELLEEANVAHLPRLAPMMIWDATFWDHFIWVNEENEKLADQIEKILFGNSPEINTSDASEDSKKFAIWLNRICDTHTLWCHLHYGNDIFVTTDRNFHKETKMPKLIALGAKRICRPEDIGL